MELVQRTPREGLDWEETSGRCWAKSHLFHNVVEARTNEQPQLVGTGTQGHVLPPLGAGEKLKDL